MKKIEIDSSARNALLAGHPWIFSGKIKSHLKEYQNGEVVYIYSGGKFLGTGIVSPENSIAIRVISRKRVELNEKYFIEKFNSLLSMRKNIIKFNTDMFRLSFGEADNLPGLIIDIYGRYIVFQTNSAGMMRKRDQIISALIEVFNPQAIVNRTDEQTYKTEHVEKLYSPKKIVYGNIDNKVIVKENGILFHVDILKGHKTGFYIDQRENRELIGQISANKNVLNLCSYSGGFSMYALSNNADYVTSVDISQKALDLCEENIKINRFPIGKHRSVKADMFEYVDSEDFGKYEIIIVDPPAFAKHITEKKQALKAYKYINSSVMKKVKSHTFILTSSCTSVVSIKDFTEVLQKAIRDSHKDIKIIKRNFLPMDHPTLINFTETQYLKSFLLFVN